MKRPASVPRRWLWLPWRTIRLRLTLLYTGLFLLSGAALLTVTYLLVEHQYTQNGASLFVRTGNARGRVTVVTRAGDVLGRQGREDSPRRPPDCRRGRGSGACAIGRGAEPAADQLGIALGLMALISIWLGWLVAGRALRPLRTMTNTAREISARNLHRRLDLEGPDDEIKQLGNTFDELLGRLEASFEAQRQFVANASHELRTPLTLERALVEVALADPDVSVRSLRRMGEQVLAVGEQQERLIEALLTLSRSQRGLDRHEPVDLLAITRGALHTVDDERLTIATKLEPAATTGDPRLIERLVANLVTNAARHNTPNGRIEVRTETRAGRALLAVDNTGPASRRRSSTGSSSRSSGSRASGRTARAAWGSGSRSSRPSQSRTRPRSTPDRGPAEASTSRSASLPPSYRTPGGHATGTAGHAAECRLSRRSADPGPGSGRGVVHDLMLAGGNHNRRKRR